MIPRHYLQHVSHIFLEFCLSTTFMRGNKFEDPINGIKYNKLLPYGLKPRENALAPDMSLERHRLMWLFLQQKTNFFTEKLKFLHVAPEFFYQFI